MDKNIVLFDGVCNLCNASVQWILKYDKKAIFTFSSIQSEFSKTTLADPELLEVKTIILLENSKIYTKSTAVLRIARKLQFPVNMLYGLIIFPKFIRDTVYDYVSRNRYKWFGKREECWLPTQELKSRFLK